MDDGQPQCVEVWVNELRLTDFDQRGGWAAIGRVNATLADLGTVSVAGNYSTPFFGSIDKKVSERSRETKYGIDAAANIELGKFLPEKSGVRIPMYVGFSENISLPQLGQKNRDTSPPLSAVLLKLLVSPVTVSASSGTPMAARWPDPVDLRQSTH